MPTNPQDLDLTLHPGVTLWRSTDGLLIAVDAEEQFVALDIEPEAAAAFLAGRVPEEPLGERTAEAIQGLLAAGFLVDDLPAAEIDVQTEGTGTVADALRTVLGDHLAVTAPDLLTAAATTRWVIQADDLASLPVDGTARPPLRVIGEGPAVSIGPWQPPGTPPGPSPTDLRRRRLAAHPAPDRLAELWTARPHLSRATAARPTTATAYAAAAWLRRELERGAPTLREHEVVVAADLSVSIHPVLAWPDPDDAHPARPDRSISLTATEAS